MIELVADENIAALEENFGRFANITRVTGRQLEPPQLQHADALLVRSVTDVNARLLEGSAVQFVGSATIGTDHVDLAYLRAAGIQFFSAPGSNAASVADYVCSALAALLPDLDSVNGAGQRAGIIGLGQVGSRVAQRLDALGYRVSAYDPLLAQGSSALLTSLDDVLRSDVISCHVPLTRSGSYPTLNMLGRELLQKLPASVVLLNTSRGSVVDEGALLSWLEQRAGAHVVLDVWQNEPAISQLLAAQVSIATPHIAGYAIDGKYRSAEMLAQNFCEYFSVTPPVQPVALGAAQLQLEGNQTLNEMLLNAYDIRADDRDLRAALRQGDSTARFDALRKNYPQRREFKATTLHFDSSPDAHRIATLQALGFQLAAPL